MIAIVSHTARERAAFSALCESRNWTSTECDSIRTFKRLLHQTKPRVVLVRHKLGDGFSDDAIAALASAALLPATKVIVLVGAGTPSSAEARQLALGADCVQRDPVRTDVLAEYLAKYTRVPRSLRTPAPASATRTVQFAGATLHATERTLQHRGQTASLTPREVELVELLAHARGQIVSYDTLYSEILGRRFRGDTSNMRVLLGRLSTSTAAIGIALRRWVEVIPKTGYRYTRVRSAALREAKPRSALLSAA